MKSSDYEKLRRRMKNPPPPVKPKPKIRPDKCTFCGEAVHEATVDSMFIEGSGHVKCLNEALRK